MNINNAFPGTYLKAADLQGRAVPIRMHNVQMEEVGGEHKVVLYFMDGAGNRKERGLVLNKTNSMIISDMYGPETDDWAGKPITLIPARVEFQGRIVDAIRVKLEAGVPIPAQRPVAQPIAQPMPQPAPAAYNGTPSPAMALPAARIGMGEIIQDEVPF